MAFTDTVDERQRHQRWSVWLVAGLAAIGGWVASSYLSNTASPTAETGYVVAQGDPATSNLGWHAIMLDDPGDDPFADAGQGFSLAGVWWRDTEQNWTHWGGPFDPAPDCLIEGVPVRATIGYVNVRGGLGGFAGTRRAVWMHCLGGPPGQP